MSKYIVKNINGTGDNDWKSWFQYWKCFLITIGIKKKTFVSDNNDKTLINEDFLRILMRGKWSIISLK